MAQTVKCSNHGRLVVTSCWKRPPSISKHTAVRHKVFSPAYVKHEGIWVFGICSPSDTIKNTMFRKLFRQQVAGSSPEDGNKSSFWNATFLRMQNNGQSPKLSNDRVLHAIIRSLWNLTAILLKIVCTCRKSCCDWQSRSPQNCAIVWRFPKPKYSIF
jgi:hypothetical protein